MVLCLSQDGACTDSFENFGYNSLKGGLSNATTFNPPLFSLVDTFNIRFTAYFKERYQNPNLLAISHSLFGYRSHPHSVRSHPHSARYHPHSGIDLIPTRLDIIPTRIDLIPTRIDLIPTRLDLIPTRLDIIPIRL